LKLSIPASVLVSDASKRLTLTMAKVVCAKDTDLIRFEEYQGRYALLFASLNVLLAIETARLKKNFIALCVAGIHHVCTILTIGHLYHTKHRIVSNFHFFKVQLNGICIHKRQRPQSKGEFRKASNTSKPTYTQIRFNKLYIYHLHCVHKYCIASFRFVP
jgi:hypothetical protein